MQIICLLLQKLYIHHFINVTLALVGNNIACYSICTSRTENKFIINQFQIGFDCDDNIMINIS